MKKYLGTHMVVDIHNASRLDCIGFQSFWKFQKVLDKLKFQVIKMEHHVFPNGAITGMFVLAESHATVHTWPEHNQMCMDIFCCSKKIKPLDCIKEIQEMFNVADNDITYKIIGRGNDE